MYNPETALWAYPAFFPAVEKVLADFETITPNTGLVFSETAKQFILSLDAIKAALRAHALPDGFDFVTTPYQHQIIGLCHIYYNLRAALYYEQGLGKSKIAIDLIRLLKFKKQPATTLIVGPRVTVQTWGREIDRHSGKALSWIALVGSPGQKKALLDRAVTENTDVALITYDSAKMIADLLVDKLPYSLLILDEAHNCKAWTSARTGAAYILAQKALRRVIMTGSPSEGNPLDLYGPLKILGDCFMPENYWKFKKTFTVTKGPTSPWIVGYKNLDIINKRVMLLASRKTKAECLDLPERTFVDLPYVLSSAQGISYNQIVSTLGIDAASLSDLVQALRGEAPGFAPALPTLPPDMALPHRAAALTKLLQITSGFLTKNNVDAMFCDTADNGKSCHHTYNCIAENIHPHTPKCLVNQSPWPTSTTVFDKNPKLDAIMDIVEEVLEDPSHKVIIWCVHLKEMDLIIQCLDTAKIGSVRMDGSTKHPQEIVDAFNIDVSVRAYVGLISMGVGITLNAASYVVYSSLPYSLIQYSQSLDRNHRIGQTSKVTVYRMIGRNTIEGLIAYLLDHKVAVDSMLTNKLECAVCPHSIRCRDEKIELFGEGCIHSRKVSKPIIKANVLPMFPGGNS